MLHQTVANSLTACIHKLLSKLCKKAPPKLPSRMHAYIVHTLRCLHLYQCRTHNPPRLPPCTHLMTPRMCKTSIHIETKQSHHLTAAKMLKVNQLGWLSANVGCCIQYVYGLGWYNMAKSGIGGITIPYGSWYLVSMSHTLCKHGVGSAYGGTVIPKAISGSHNNLPMQRTMSCNSCLSSSMHWLSIKWMQCANAPSKVATVTRRNLR